MSFSISQDANHLYYKNCTISLQSRGDIVDDQGVIVNASKAKAYNKSDPKTGGINGHIQEHAGQEKLLKACKKALNGKTLGVSQVIRTKAYKLKNAHAIYHVNSPNFKKYYKSNEQKNAKQDLYNAYNNCMQLAQSNNEKRISFPTLSGGKFFNPQVLGRQDMARVALKAIVNGLVQGAVKTVTLHCTGETFDHYQALFKSTAKSGKIQ